MFIIVHLKLFLFLSLIEIFLKGMGNFLETVLGIQILLPRSAWTKEWSDDIPFCHNISCNTFLTYLFH